MPSINKVQIMNPSTNELETYTIDGSAGTADVVGATSSADGEHGLVPQPKAGDHVKALCGDGTWVDMVNKVNGYTGNVTLTPEDVEAVPAADVGVPSGVAELDATGKLVLSQIPGTVGQVHEEVTRNDFPATGEPSTMYIALDTNKVYRWSGSTYVEISQGAVIGTTSESASRGDWGLRAYNHAQAAGHTFAEGLYKITTNEEGHVTDATAVVKKDITDLGITGYDLVVTTEAGRGSDPNTLYFCS